VSGRGAAIVRRAVVAAMLLAPALASADADEAALHVQLVGGIARVGDDAAADGEPATTPLVGIMGRFGYATHDWFQYDAALTLVGTAAARFDEGTFMPPDVPEAIGPFELSQQLARIDAGITARFGVRFIPTIRLALGAQARHVTAPVVTIAGGVELADARPASLDVDLVGVASVGFDYRVNRRTIIGLAVGGSYAVPLGGASYQSVEGTVFWSHYWYPRW